MATETETTKVTIYDLGYSKTITKDDDFYTENAQVVSKITDGVASSSVTGGESTSNTTMTDGMYRSSNYVYGVSGWSLEPDDAFFWNVTISGTLISSNIHIPDKDTTANSFHTDSDGNSWWGCTETSFNADHNNAAAYVLKTGAARFSSATVTGILTATAGSSINFSYVDGATKPDDNATVGATWGTDLSNIPATLGTPGTSGLYLSSTYMGFYNGSAWKTYIDSSGNLLLGDIAGGNTGLSWNQGTGALTIKGAVTITGGDIPWANVSGANKPADNATVGATWGTDLSNIPATLGTPSADGLYLTSVYLGYYKSGAWTSFIKNDGSFYFAGDAGSHIDWNVTTPATMTIAGAMTATAGSVIATTYLSGLVGLANENIAAQGWTSTLVFSATNYRVVAWASGVITTAAGTSYNIDAGNTGNMTASTYYYIYLDIAVSTTVLQVTTTATTANGSGKIHIATAYPNTDTTSEAQFQAFGGLGGTRIFVDNICANINSTNEFISNSAQIADATITNAKIVSLVADKITAGSGIINNLSVLSTLTMGSAVTDGIIQSYGWNGTANGFQIKGGASPSVSVIGGTITGGTIQTAASGARIVMNLTSDEVTGLSAGLGSIDSNGYVSLGMMPNGRIYNSYYGGGVYDMNVFNNRSLSNGNNSSSVMVLNYQDIITDGGTQTNTGIKLFVRSYSPMTFGQSTKSISGTLDLGGHWTINSSINQLLWSGSDSGYDFGGNNSGTSAKNYKIEIDGTGSPNTFKWSDDGGSTWNDTGVNVEAGPAGSEIGGGILLESSDGSQVYIYFNNTTGGVIGDYWTFTSGANSNATGQTAAFIDYHTISTSEVLLLGKVATTSTNFYKMISFLTGDGTNYLWASNGTSPNGSLSGTAGDICINGDGGKCYYCTGTTNWTAM